jgi:hypothetical protein
MSGGLQEIPEDIKSFQSKLQKLQATFQEID